MEGFKGTPGKWFYQEDSDAYTHIVRPELQPGWIISHLSQDTSGIAEADARLIAASPELLEACQKAMECYDQKGQLLSFDVNIIRQAIKKALGQ